MSLFSVGEAVILQSKSYPELNGECVVIYVDVERRVNDGTFQIGYKTTIPTPDSVCWAESALRKKQEPGDDYDTIMDRIKRGDVVEA